MLEVLGKRFYELHLLHFLFQRVLLLAKQEIVNTLKTFSHKNVDAK